MFNLHHFLLSTITGELFQKPFIEAIIGATSSVLGGIAGANASKSAAGIEAKTKDAATKESARQFDITQEQLKPFREAGLRGLNQYASMLGEYGNYDITNQLPEAFQSNRDLPQFSFESGNYSVQSDIPENFAYDNSNYLDDPSRANMIGGGLEALANRGVTYQGDPSQMGSNLATRGYSGARANAFTDYGTAVARERDAYGRSSADYDRRTGREAELYSRGRQNYADRSRRESSLEDRRFTDYQSQVAREEEMRRRDLEAYGRNYVDPLNRYAQLAGLGQSTTTGLGSLRQSYADTIARNTAEAGRARAAGIIGQSNAYANAAGGLAQYFGEQYGRR